MTEVERSVVGADVDTHHTRPTHQQIDRLCVRGCRRSNSRNFQVPFVSPQRPPHLISSLKGMCGSIADFCSPLQLCTHTHIHTNTPTGAGTHTCTELCSRSFTTSCRSSECGQVQSGPADPGCWRGPMFVCVCVCVFMR